MKASRLAVWIVGAAVSGAWLASAAGITRQARVVPIATRPADVVQFEALAAEVQAQTGRLRERLANAPAPATAERNPFSFYTAPPPRRETTAAARPGVQVEPEPAVPEIREPVLELIGIAETIEGDGVIRTATMTGEYDELIMVTVGQRILSRYDVIAVGADAVELKDIETGATRRLILR